MIFIRDFPGALGVLSSEDFFAARFFTPTVFCFTRSWLRNVLAGKLHGATLDLLRWTWGGSGSQRLSFNASRVTSPSTMFGLTSWKKTKPTTLDQVKKRVMLSLILMYLIFTVWWLASPKSVLTVLIQRGATETVCTETGGINDEICRSLLFLTRFAGVYFFLIMSSLAGIFYVAFVRHPGNVVASEAVSACLAAFVPTSLIAAVLYVDISVATYQDNTTPVIPEWFINVTNFPFVATICFVLVVEWSQRKAADPTTAVGPPTRTSARHRSKSPAPRVRVK